MRQNGAQRRVDLGREEPVSFARRITEHAVHDVRRRFESQRAFDFLASTPEAVCVIDDRQRLVLWNAGARELLGFEASDVVGRCCFEVLQAQDPTGAAVCRRCCSSRRVTCR
jgi:PAS domain-containing protein